MTPFTVTATVSFVDPSALLTVNMNVRVVWSVTLGAAKVAVLVFEFVKTTSGPASTCSQRYVNELST